MTTKEFIAYYERAYNTKLNMPQLLASASFFSGYALAAQDLGEVGGDKLAACAEDFMVAVRILAELQRRAVEETR